MEKNKEVVLASRWNRFWASTIDALLMALVTMPVVYFTGGFEEVDGKLVEQSFTYETLIGLLGIIVFIAFNYKFLIHNGQTIGKKILKIKIVELDNTLPSKRTLLNRYLVYFVPTYIPVVGSWLSLINILFIFGKEKRCIHDYIAKTKVIDVEPIKVESIPPTIEETENNFKISFKMKDDEIWNNLKDELLEYYKQYGLTKIASDKDDSWMLNNDNYDDFKYVGLTMKKNIIYIDIFKTEKPNTNIINDVIEEINAQKV